MTDFMSEYAKHQAARAKANALNKTVLFDALSGAGITSVHAEFDGSGDSGQINDVTACAGDQTAEFPCVAILLHDTQWGKQELATKKINLREAVEDLCYGCLDRRIRAGKTTTAPAANSP